MSDKEFDAEIKWACKDISSSLIQTAKDYCVRDFSNQINLLNLPFERVCQVP